MPAQSGHMLFVVILILTYINLKYMRSNTDAMGGVIT